MAKNSKKLSNQDIYQRVTDIILDALNKGVVPWKRPWSVKQGSSTLHMNMVTKSPYRGINQFLCELTAASKGYDSNLWLSFKQVEAKGGKILKGEKGTLITFWKIMRIKTDEIDAKGKPVIKTIPLLRYYYVWNLAQCEGIKVPEPKEDEPKVTFTPIEQAQAVIDNMQNRPITYHDGNRAFYSPAADTVTLPLPEDFHTPEGYYNTAFHEYVHSTGHKDRLGRVTDWTTFGSDPYANEELVAELGAAMLCATIGIVNDEHEQSAAYIQSWIKRFQNDPKLIISAAGKAQKAADYIQNLSFNTETVEEEKELVNA